MYTASHDLRAPITNIEGLLLALIQDPVARFQQTLGYLSDVAQLQLTQTEPTEALNLAAHIEAVRLDLAPLLAVSQGNCLWT